MTKQPEKQIKLKRKNRIVFHFNEPEMQAFERYCKKYKVSNRAKFIREAVITAVLQRFDLDYPSLFDNPDQENTGNLF
jgi:hypothetical protein